MPGRFRLLEYLIGGLSVRPLGDPSANPSPYPPALARSVQRFISGHCHRHVIPNPFYFPGEPEGETARSGSQVYLQRWEQASTLTCQLAHAQARFDNDDTDCSNKVKSASLDSSGKN
jgi:hypothetical protein